eukprot:m.3390 g.3390  ORF g.3390 m.3390 type:complete len:145 (+) comp9337_c0_seq2:33-467(+)
MARAVLFSANWRVLMAPSLLSRRARYGPCAPVQRCHLLTGAATQTQRSPWILRWLVNDKEEAKIVDSVKTQEMEDMLERVRAMYFAKRPMAPDLAFFKEAFQLFIKYGDRCGVKIVCQLFKQSGIEPDQEIKDMVSSFLEEQSG